MCGATRNRRVSSPGKELDPLSKNLLAENGQKAFVCTDDRDKELLGPEESANNLEQVSEHLPLEKML